MTKREWQRFLNDQQMKLRMHFTIEGFFEFAKDLLQANDKESMRALQAIETLKEQLELERSLP